MYHKLVVGVTRTNIPGKNVGCAGRGGEQAREATAQGTGGNIWKCHRKGRLRGGSEVKRKPSEDWWQTISAPRVLDEARLTRLYLLPKQNQDSWRSELKMEKKSTSRPEQGMSLRSARARLIPA